MLLKHIPTLVLILLLVLTHNISARTRFDSKNTEPKSTLSLSSLKTHVLSTKDGGIEYYRFGKGSPIVLLPGYLTDISSWPQRFLKTLALEHELIVLNYPGVGHSKPLPVNYKPIDFAHDIFHVIQKLRLKKPTLVGISMGGMVAQLVSVHHQESLSHLILINTAIAGENSKRPSAEIQKQILHMPNALIGRFWVADHLFFPFFTRLPMGIALISDRFLPADYKPINPRLVNRFQRHFILEWAKDNTSAKKIKQLHLPVLILNGKADGVIPPH